MLIVVGEEHPGFIAGAPALIDDALKRAEQLRDEVNREFSARVRDAI
jgi:hypothetical protein